MRSQFAWYFRVDSAAIAKIWKDGILTVDANVLLDLYRYHQGTRDSLLAGLAAFKGRLWLSNQSAQEFFRNRARVIVGANSGFKAATEEIENLRKASAKSLAQLRSNRILPEEPIQKLSDSLDSVLTAVSVAIDKAQSEFPKYLEQDSDPILQTILAYFDAAVGAPFDEERLKGLKAEAERRKKAKVPPGYLDDDKDGDRPYGDFFLWQQILDHAKSAGRPIIFVTSERKEDWWERPSGVTVGPRSELLKEAHEVAGQKVLIYQTDRFLQYSAEREGAALSQEVVEEIRALDDLRSGSVVLFIAQLVEKNGPDFNEGTLSIELKRPTFRFTASGHFFPVMNSVPVLRADLSSGPAELPVFKVSAGTGTKHDFNIHLGSKTPGIPLPVGVYKFRYSARVRVPADT
ncbi:MAG TPA: PIN domain-containing protein [Burkholderiaceae bacterium]|jgi:hypothetical protein|nr:PIN domain-containing protein [Burkholderiaceae bacterium]